MPSGKNFANSASSADFELDAISNTTKISTRMLRALEDEQFDQLPGGVFNKGFVRAYARQIGLDEEEAVADYLAALRESQIQQQSILPDFRAAASKPAPLAAPNLGNHPIPTSEHRDEIPTSHDLSTSSDDGDDHNPGTEDRRRQGRRNQDRRRNNEPKYPAGEPDPTNDSSARIPWGKLALALLLITAAVGFWNFRRHAQPMAASPGAASPVVAAPNHSPAPASARASTANRPSPAASLNTGPASPEKDLPAGTASQAPISAATSPPHTNSAPATRAAPPAPSASPVSPKPSPVASAASAATKPIANPSQPDKLTTTHAVAPAATVKPLTTLNLLIRAEETTWISLIADGKPITHETLIAPAHTSIRATREIVVRAGNAAGISFLLNGKEIPAQGNEGEVKTYIFDATGVHLAPQTQPAATNR